MIASEIEAEGGWAEARLRLKAHTFYEHRRQFITTEGAFESWVMIVPESGTFRYNVQETQGEAGFGELVVAPPDGAFERWVTSDTLTYHVIQWWADSEPAKSPAATFPCGKLRIGDTARLASSLAMLRPLLGQSDPMPRRRIENLLEDLMLMAWETRHVRAIVPDPAMQKAAQILRAKAADSFSMKAVASDLGLGQVQFTRRFRVCHGLTPIAFVTEVRLQRARKLLIETDWTIDKIARNCGWASGFYLSNLFTQKTGDSPSAFRRRYRI